MSLFAAGSLTSRMRCDTFMACCAGYETSTMRSISSSGRRATGRYALWSWAAQTMLRQPPKCRTVRALRSRELQARGRAIGKCPAHPLAKLAVRVQGGWDKLETCCGTATAPFYATFLSQTSLCRYFGAAKQLPGVKELFEKDAPRQVRTSLRPPRIILFSPLSFSGCRVHKVLYNPGIRPLSTATCAAPHCQDLCKAQLWL